MSVKFNLYGTLGCHLCDDALALCTADIPVEEISVVDIIDDEKLLELYRISIPVLERLSDHKKLFWPFDQAQILELL
ncbi:thioredoxin family protein [Colwellia sp. M166]|uniref:glutaredoxin family protein n=1 Tax=Colwellia sp. M166 TaxID=2583805 RepID=UPI00211EB06A|nr:glutaredoxin family protein [Colwellia sp. M166]UUO25186.1 thioredoxin family protein [Colwellia sp. M166]|tara:strand:+ start:333 stop:563 length:231 start_codon:yes stop_codon:yes gene_type:complete